VLLLAEHLGPEEHDDGPEKAATEDEVGQGILPGSRRDGHHFKVLHRSNLWSKVGIRVNPHINELIANNMPNRQADTITASEIGEFVFCPEAWRLGALGHQSANQAIR
jgi:hypothetical protein